MSSTISGYSAYQSGKAQQDAYEDNAETLRAQSAANLKLAGNEMASMRAQQSSDTATARAASAASGLTSEGTGMTREVDIAKKWNDQVSTASLSITQEDVNTRHQADMSDWQGEMAYAQGKASLAAGIFEDVIKLTAGVVTGGWSWAADADAAAGGAAGGAAAAAEDGGFSWRGAASQSAKFLF